MKKFLMGVWVLSLLLCMAQVSVAEDRLTLSGDHRIRAYYYDFNDTGSDDDNVYKFIDMRFRLGLKIAVTEGITANLRADFHDDAIWGVNYGIQGRPSDEDIYSDEGVEMEIDRAFIRIEKEKFIFQGGQIFQGFGHLSAYSPQGTGFAVQSKDLPVTIDVNYFKYSESSSTTPSTSPLEDDEDVDKDSDVYAIQGTYKADTFTIGGYYGTVIDGAKAVYENKNVIGLWGFGKVGPVAIKGSLDILGGTKNDTVDYMGTQMWVNGEMKLIDDDLTAGANVYYALAADDDGTEEQITRLLEATELTYAPFDPHQKVMYPFRYSECINSLSGVLQPRIPYDLHTPFEMSVSAANAGVQALDVYGLYKVRKDLTLGASVGYFLPQDDDLTDWEHSLLLQGSILYAFAPRCDIFGGIYHRDDEIEDTETDAELGAIAVLMINW